MSNLLTKIPLYILFSTIMILASKLIRDGKEEKEKNQKKIDYSHYFSPLV
jgi:hypothetical protein